MKRIILVLLALIASYAAWWLFLRSAERQITAVQGGFLAALEGHRWDQAQGMLAPDFASSAGHTRDTVMPDLKQALGSFITLDIEATTQAIQASKDLGLVTQKIRLIGLGDGIAIAVRERANQIRTPWLFHWRKVGRWPWDWQLTQVHNDGFSDDGLRPATFQGP
jgi:hypothetical protein